MTRIEKDGQNYMYSATDRYQNGTDVPTPQKIIMNQSKRHKVQTKGLNRANKNKNLRERNAGLKCIKNTK